MGVDTYLYYDLFGYLYFIIKSLTRICTQDRPKEGRLVHVNALNERALDTHEYIIKFFTF